MAAPNGNNGAATFRSLVANDLPIVPITKGGTGASNASAARINLGAVEMGTGTSAAIHNNLGNSDQLFYIQSAASAKATLKNHRTWLVVRDNGLNVWDADTAKAPWNLTFPVSIANGGTGATAANLAFKNMTNDNLGTGIQYVAGLTTSWARTGYSTLANLRSAMGLGNTTGVLPVANGGTGKNVPFTANTINLAPGQTKTFNMAGGKLINFIARFNTGTAALASLTIPCFITTAGDWFQITDDVNWVKFRLRNTGSNNYTIDNYTASNTNCRITHVNIIY